MEPQKRRMEHILPFKHLGSVRLNEKGHSIHQRILKNCISVSRKILCSTTVFNIDNIKKIKNVDTSIKAWCCHFNGAWTWLISCEWCGRALWWFPNLWPGRGWFGTSLLHLYTGTHCTALETRQPPQTEKSHSPSTGCYALACIHTQNFRNQHTAAPTGNWTLKMHTCHCIR